MADYSAGNLELDVLGISDKALVSIDKTVKSLNSLSRAITKINQTQFVLAGQKMEILFSKIAKSTNSINTANLSNLSSAAKSLSALSRIGNLQNVDFDKIGNGFNNLTVAITPFLDKVKEAEISLSSLHGILQKSSGKKIQGLLGSGENNKSGRKGFGLLNIAGWTSTLYMAKRLGDKVAKIAQSGADYTETLNLWQTAMGNNLNVATQFVNKMNEAYGVSEKTLMNAQAIFKNMLGSLGQISDSMAYSLSEGVTQMALDYASLYNVTFEQAFTKFQAALAGQVRPIRSVAGYDITENTLFQLYQSLGGTKTMRQLSRTEKQLLSILAIFRQMNASGAVGDLDKTMESYANQSRVMAESWQRVMSYSGILLTHTIQQWGILKYINAFLIFLGDTLKAVVDYYGAMESFGDPFEAMTNGAESANDEIDKLQGKLLGFDKFRSMNGAGEGDIGLDSKLLEALSSYETVLAGASMEAQNLARQLGVVTGLFDESGIFNPDKWNELLSNMKSILGVIISIYSISQGAQIIKFAKNVLPQISFAIMEVLTTTKGLTSNVTLLGKAFSFLLNHPIIAVLAAIAGVMVYLYNTNEQFRESINELFTAFAPLFSLIGNFLTTVLTPFSNILNGIISNLVAPALTVAIQIITHSILSAFLVLTPFVYMLEFMLKIVSTIVEFVGTLFTWDWAGLGNRMSDLWGNWATTDFATNIIGQLDSSLVTADASSGFDSTSANSNVVYGNQTIQQSGNNAQTIAQATYNGTTKALDDWWVKARKDIPQLESANPTGMYQAVTGVARSYGQRWSK